MNSIKMLKLLILLFVVSNSPAQSLLEGNKVSLQPDESAALQITRPLCMKLESDYLTELNILGKRYDWTLPKGMKYVVGAGEYRVKNQGRSVLEFVLLPVSVCQEY